MSTYRRTLVSIILLLAITPFALAQVPANDPATYRDIAVYHRGIAEITETREIDIEKGENNVLLPFIPVTAVAGSFRLDVVDGRVETRSIALALDLIDEDLMWEAQVGHYVDLETYDSTYSGTLKRVTNSLFFLESEDGFILSIPYSDVKAPKLTEWPGDLVPETSLRWTYSSKKRQTVKIEISYRVEHIDWYADYRLMTDKGAALMQGMTVIENFSNLPLAYDKLILVAGDVHLAGDKRQVDRMNPQPGAVLSQGESSGEIRTWIIEEKGIIRSGHATELPLIEVDNLPVQTRYVYDAAIFNDRVTTHLDVDWSSASATALPAGTIRMYRDHDGEMLFIGEDRIDNTPAGSPLDLTANQAFDLTAKRIRMQEKPSGADGTEQTFKVELGNSMPTLVNIEVLERMFGNWSMKDVHYSQGEVEPETIDARTVKFNVSVPAGKTAELIYTVQYKRAG